MFELSYTPLTGPSTSRFFYRCYLCSGIPDFEVVIQIKLSDNYYRSLHTYNICTPCKDSTAHLNVPNAEFIRLYYPPCSGKCYVCGSTAVYQLYRGGKSTLCLCAKPECIAFGELRYV